MPNAIRRKSEEFRVKQGEWGSHLPEVNIIGKTACQYSCGPSHNDCFFVISHGRRRILRVNDTRHPTSGRIMQQLRAAFPFGSTPKSLIFDRDAKYGQDLPAAVRSLEMSPVQTSFGSPWQNGVAERWVEGCRRDRIKNWSRTISGEKFPFHKESIKSDFPQRVSQV